MYKVAILALPGCMQSAVIGCVDILLLGSKQWEKSHLNPQLGPLFSVTTLSPDPLKETRCYNNLLLKTDDTIFENTKYDIIIIPPLLDDFSTLLTHTKLLCWLVQQSENHTCICSVCAGAFLLAQSGLLQDKKATTHIQLADKFCSQYPSINLQKEKMIIDEGNIITAGGVTGYMDLCLYLMRRFGSQDLARVLSKLLLIDPARESQQPYATQPAIKTHGDEQILLLQSWLDENFNQPHSIKKMAEIAVMGERSLLRRFKKATGDSPSQYVQQIRVNKARTLLETTKRPVEDIMNQVGYQDTSSFRRLFKKKCGVSPTEYRKKFSILT